MKVRGGFVSNSSSSSFIIGLPVGEEVNFTTVAKAMFPDNPNLRGGFGHGHGLGVSTPEAVRSVQTKIEEAGPATKDTLGETIHSLSYGGCPEFLREIAKQEPDYETIIYGSREYRHQNHNMSREEQTAKWREYDKLSAEWREKAVAVFEEYAKQHNITWYVVEYSDDTSFESAMEHGGVFDHMIDRGLAIRISNH